jgi:serine protease Do
VLEGRRTDEVVVRLVPADGVDAAEGLHIGIADRADDDIGNNLGAHLLRLSQPARETKSGDNPGAGLSACPTRVRWQPGAAASSPGPTAPSNGPVGFDGVQSATIQLEAVGTFVSPEEGGYESAGRGSGFIITSDGLAVTNNHVVTGAGTLKVWRGGDTTNELSAKVLGSSECLDLAVVQLEQGDYPFMDWRKGEIKTALDVYAAGFPLGDPRFTETKGIVSKAITSGETPWASIDGVIEHDARIRGGNSGGPLIDAKGALVGVNYAGNDELDYNYAIHRDEVLEVISDLVDGEDVLSLGINGEALVGEDGAGLGVWVNSVKSGSAAPTSPRRAST